MAITEELLGTLDLEIEAEERTHARELAGLEVEGLAPVYLPD
jgi:hypothetical protein